MYKQTGEIIIKQPKRNRLGGLAEQSDFLPEIIHLGKKSDSERVLSLDFEHV